MFFLFFQLCTVIALTPLVLSLNITFKDSAPEVFRSTPISLHRDQDDPYEFVLGASTVDGKVAVTTNQVVTNFTADRIVNMTFNYISLSEKDCILLAWLHLSSTQSRNTFTQSEPFSVTSGPATTVTPPLFVTITPPFPSTSPTSSPATSSITSSVSGNAQSTTNLKAIPTEAVVGAVIGAFVLLSIVSAALFILLRRRRNRKLKESAPSRAFWRYLDRKGPPISRPVPPARENLPAYTAQNRTFQRPAVRPPNLRLPDEYYLHGNL